MEKNNYLSINMMFLLTITIYLAGFDKLRYKLQLTLITLMCIFYN